ncbi:MAG: rod-binding protein [Desulfobacterales bacterium]
MKLALDPHVSHGIQAPGRADQNFTGRGDPEALRQACTEFEAVLVNTVFQSMRKTIPDDGYLESDMSLDFYQEMLYTEAAGHTARKGGFGLAELLYEQFEGNENKP